MRIRAVVLALLGLSLSVSVPAAAADMLPLAVHGNQILRGGAPFNFYGVNRDTLEWGDNNWGGCGGDGHFTDSDFNNIAAWKVSVIRLPLSEADWLGRRCAGFNYPAAVDAVIQKANARGIYVILDLHWTDVGGLAPCDSSCGSGEQQMPDSDSVTFWRQVAARYANNPGVMFDLFNEPHYVSWSCWLGGGCPVIANGWGSGNQGAAQPSYTAVGMQQLYNAVRATGAQNLTIVGGLDWAYDLSGVINGYALTGTNIVYDTHVYTYWHNTISDWDQHFGWVAQHYPVVALELGTTDCSAAGPQALLNYLWAPDGVAADRIGWAGWSWNAPGSCSQPSLIADWSGTPLGGQGQLIHDKLAWIATQPAAPAGQPFSSQWNELVNHGTGGCADAAGWGTGNGTAVQQWTCGSGQANQEWQLVPTLSGYYEILNRNASGQNEVMDVSGGPGATGDGAQIQLWQYAGASNQQWQPVALANGYYELVARNSGKCLDVTGGSSGNGVRLQQWTCYGGPNQAFRLTAEP